VSESWKPHGLQHSRLPCPSPTARTCFNLCPSHWWCHPTISSSVIPFFCFHFFPASGSFLMSQFFASGGLSIGVSASTSVLPMNIQDWFPLGWTGWISLQSKGLSRVISNTSSKALVLLFQFIFGTIWCVFLFIFSKLTIWQIVWLVRCLGFNLQVQCFFGGDGYVHFLNWRIVDLQCFVRFRYASKWISYTYTYIHTFLILTHIGHYRVLSRGPCAMQ